ncbi:MAG: sodium/glutamate symporter [Halanaerobiales bacterium]
MSASTIGFSLLILGLLLAVGKLIRVKIELFQDLFLPSSIIAGFVGLFLGPEVLGKFDFANSLKAGIFTDNILKVWSELPGLMIIVVFASLFLGRKIPNIKKVWNLAGPQIVLGYIFSFGQYIVGILLVLLFLKPVFGIDPMAGALIEIGFVGGHGTAAGMANTYQQLGFSEGAPMAMGMATVGILGGVILGMMIINWGIRNDKLTAIDKIDIENNVNKNGLFKQENRSIAGYLSTGSESIEPLSLHFGYLSLSILIGVIILDLLQWIEAVSWGPASGVFLIEHVPLFPIAMIGGIVLQKLLDKYDSYHTLDRGLINRIQGFSLDILIASALATLDLSVIGENIIPFLTLALGGILWTLFVLLYLAPKILTSYWLERGIGDFGQSTGVAATGLMLMKVADPENETPALESFGYKQILFEPFVGGGLFTASSVPLIHQFGAVNILSILGVIVFLLLIFGLMGFKN